MALEGNATVVVAMQRSALSVSPKKEGMGILAI
jgi:hypothetical protein